MSERFTIQVDRIQGGVHVWVIANVNGLTQWEAAMRWPPSAEGRAAMAHTGAKLLHDPRETRWLERAVREQLRGERGRAAS